MPDWQCSWRGTVVPCRTPLRIPNRVVDSIRRGLPGEAAPRTDETCRVSPLLFRTPNRQCLQQPQERRTSMPRTPVKTWLNRQDSRRSRVSREFTAALNATLVSGTGLPAIEERTVASRRGRHADSGPIRRRRNLRRLPARSRGPIGVAFGAVSHGSPAGVTDVPAPGTIRWPPSHRPLAARGGRCAPPPDSVRLPLRRVATSRAGWESPCLMHPTVPKARPSRTSPTRRPLDRGRNQTRMDWINEWTRDQWNERRVASETCWM